LTRGSSGSSAASQPPWLRTPRHVPEIDNSNHDKKLETPPWLRTPHHDPSIDKSKHDKERDARLKARDSVAAIARARHARRVIEYLQQCPDAAQKQDQIRRLIEGCSGFAPPSSEDLWQRLIQLSKTIASAPQDARC
jgi:hypothetical protein